MADAEDYRRRLALLRRYIPSFGIGAPCGYGRLNPERLPGLLADHMKALELLHERR
jgi:hypothetical protein